MGNIDAELKSFLRWENLKPYCTDPSLLTVEALFVILTLCNVYVLHALFTVVIPAPIFVTWWQLTQGLLTAWTLGDFGVHFPKLAYFPPVVIEWDMLRTLALPTVAYVAMLCSSNMLLSKTPTTAAFPILASGAVAAHHAARFIACGEEYLPMRWKSIGFLLLAFLLGATDPKVAPANVLTISFMYAFLAAVFRAGFMEQALHIVGGRGNALHNHQHLLACIGLPIVWIFSGELGTLINTLPFDITSTRTWHVWGCFFTVGALPFIKNVISNRLIRQTGQAPWRCLELISVALLFVIGSMQQTPSWQAILATLFVLFGRLLGAFDVIRNLHFESLDTDREASRAFLDETQEPAEMTAA
ncbi:hypothetical protein BdWA1_001252 [Babesia duncani]|uniref:Uncharacterized protein n=1 Tax=Babesia duncani TaxID=323732 RepID=A0AAD9PNV5_9APIC|nr:hypothetical protein BdWA1_001252 [Babesia duncani]